MTDSYITIERDGPVALVRFDRKKNLNAFDEQLILELTEVARSFHNDLDTRAVVLTGTNDYFSAGADLEDLTKRNDPAIGDMERRQIFYRGVRLCEAWQAMPQVTVAAMERLAVNATVTALNYTASYADADQSQLGAASQDARTASERFNAR